MYLKSTLGLALSYVLILGASFSTSFAGLIWLLGAPWAWPLAESHRALAVLSFLLAGFATDQIWRAVHLGE